MNIKSALLSLRAERGCFVVPPRNDSVATPNFKTRFCTLGLLRRRTSPSQ